MISILVEDGWIVRLKFIHKRILLLVHFTKAEAFEDGADRGTPN